MRQTHYLHSTSNSSSGSFEFVSYCNINPQKEKGLELAEVLLLSLLCRKLVVKMRKVKNARHS